MPHLRLERIDAAVEHLSDRAFAFLDLLVRERSLPGDETGAERVLAEELARIGLAVERLWITAGNLAEAYRVDRGMASGVEPWSAIVRDMLAPDRPA